MLATQYIRTLLCVLITMSVSCYADDLDDQLIKAIQNNDLERCKTLISDGADVNAKNDWHEQTPLHNAAYYGHLKIAELLIKKGAKVNAKDSDGWTPLHKAAYKGHLEVAKLLIEKGADVNAKNKWGWTPLDLVHKSYHPELYKLLKSYQKKW